MSRYQCLASFLLLAASGLTIGCAQPATEAGAEAHAKSTPGNEAAKSATSSSSATTEPAAKPAAAAAPHGDSAKSAAAGEKGSSAAAGNTAAKDAVVEAFQPPYPQRENMFRRPNTDNAVKAARAENNNAVELKGFVNMGGLRAVLVIDGKTVTLKQGEQRGDIEVIEVTPPKVILQRGRNRWTTQLFESTVTKTAGLSN